MAGGRQREFDKEGALNKAMLVFWKQGYVGASLADLTKSMGINKPSMYSTFGNKEQLFVKAMHHYLDLYAKPLGAHLTTDEPTIVRLKNYLVAVIQGQCSDDSPKGCYVSMCIGESEADLFPEVISNLVEEVNYYSETYLIDFLKKEQALGNVPVDVDSEKAARFLTTFLHGTGLMARGERTEAELTSLVDLALEAVF